MTTLQRDESACGRCRCNRPDTPVLPVRLEFPSCPPGGRVKTGRSAAKSDATASIPETAYDTAGRIVARRTDAAPWSCRSYVAACSIAKTRPDDRRHRPNRRLAQLDRTPSPGQACLLIGAGPLGEPARRRCGGNFLVWLHVVSPTGAGRIRTRPSPSSIGNPTVSGRSRWRGSAGRYRGAYCRAPGA